MKAIYPQRGFMINELLLVLCALLLLSLFGVASLSSKSLQARTAALGFQGMVKAARTLAGANALEAMPGNDSGATIAVTSENGHTVARLYLGRPFMGTLKADSHVPPLITNADVSVADGSRIWPPFVILISSSGYAELAPSFKVKSVLPPAVTSCPSGGYTLRFSAGLRTEDHQLSCEDASLGTNS